MSNTDKDVYRFVPHRFIFNDLNMDTCKLEKLTNLFPDMKGIIELELFKINNLTRTIERLSNIYTVLNAVDSRDDTLHLFLGPYHISLGPAIFGALQFKNISTALLASSHSKNSNENKRRHDAALRRFRRAVRKLIQIKSIIDQLRLASILTPYNQYELYKQGIYDLVLSGHKHRLHSVFDDDDFLKEINDFHLKNNFLKDHTFLTSKFVKINTLLHLLSPSPHQTDHNSTQNKSDDTKKENSLIDSTTICCAQHAQTMPPVMIPISRSINRSISHQSTHFVSSPDSHSRRTSTLNSRRNSSILPNKVVTNSLPDLFINDNSDKTLNSKTLQTNISSNQEDAFVNRISLLLTNYLLTQQPIITSSHTHDHHEKLEDSTDSLLFQDTDTTSNDDNNRSEQSLSVTENNEFDKLLQRIKNVVDNNLSKNSTKTITNMNAQKTSIDDRNIEPSINKHKLRLSSKSQSFDDTNLKLTSTIPELTDT